MCAIQFSYWVQWLSIVPVRNSGLYQRCVGIDLRLVEHIIILLVWGKQKSNVWEIHLVECLLISILQSMTLYYFKNVDINKSKKG